MIFFIEKTLFLLYFMGMSLALFIFYTFVVMFVSLRPAGGEPASIQEYDKFAHVIIYGIFALLAIPLANTRERLLYFCLAIAFFGGLMEVGQHFSPGRFMSLDDFLANLIGVGIGGAIGCYVIGKK